MHGSIKRYKKLVNWQAAYRCIYHCALLLLQLNDPALDAIFDHQFDGLHRTVLAQAMNSIHGLILHGRVPNPLSAPTNKYRRETEKWEQDTGSTEVRVRHTTNCP